MVVIASAGVAASADVVTSPSLQTKELPCIEAVIALRAATQALHEQLDQSLPLARSDAVLADYAAHLTLLRDWQLALAPRLPRATIDAAALALLEQDLRDCPAQARALASLPVPDLSALRQADDGREGFCWGIADVVEGLRLGGLLFYQRLFRQFAPHPLRYLGQRGRTGASWPDPLACLRSHLAVKPELQSACNGAVAAFDMLLLRFRREGCTA